MLASTITVIAYINVGSLLVQRSLEITTSVALMAVVIMGVLVGRGYVFIPVASAVIGDPYQRGIETQQRSVARFLAQVYFSRNRLIFDPCSGPSGRLAQISPAIRFYRRVYCH